MVRRAAVAMVQALPESDEVSFAVGRLYDVPAKSTSLVSTVPAVRPGAVW